MDSAESSSSRDGRGIAEQSSLDQEARALAQWNHPDWSQEREHALINAPVDDAFQASIMAKLERAAAGDPALALCLRTAQEDPAKLLAAADIDPGIVRNLVNFFLRQMEEDPTPGTAIEIAKIFLATKAPSPGSSVVEDVPELVASVCGSSNASAPYACSSDEEYRGCN